MKACCWTRELPRKRDRKTRRGSSTPAAPPAFPRARCSPTATCCSRPRPTSPTSTASPRPTPPRTPRRSRMARAFTARRPPTAAALPPAPLSHGSGLYGLPHFAAGAVNVIPESGQFDPAEIFDLLERWPNGSFFAAPTMIVRLMASPAPRPPRGLKTITYGGAPMYVADCLRAFELFGPRLYQLFGQGEAPMTIAGLSQALHKEQFVEKLSTCGIARTGGEVKVFEEEDRELPAGEVGEIVTRSDCVMAGYWGNPQATASTLRGGWLHTGDLGS